ncbi:MAG: hypothetical protein ACFFEF_07545 [Candidatus Thorarchaeota archaeon]
MTSTLSSFVSDRYREIYLLAFMSGFVLLIIMLYQSSWSFDVLLGSELMLNLFTISGTTMNFLSGIGIMLTYATFCAIAFRVSSEYMKRSTSRARLIKRALLIPIIGIVIYALYKMMAVFILGQTLGLIETLVSLYGVWSLLLSVYILPAFKGRYQPETQETATDKLRKRADDFGFSLWKGYQVKIRGDYGKVYSKEFERYAARMDRIRSQLSGVLLLPLGLILLVFPPIAGVLLVFWIRSLDSRPLSLLEEILLVIMVAGVLLLSTYVILVQSYTVTLVVLDISYALGIFLSIMLLASVVTKS